MQDTILSISGKPGLFRLVTQGRSTIIVETLDSARKRFPVSLRDRITSLNDVSMYTADEDKPLMHVFEAIRKKEDGAPVAIDLKKATAQELADFMAAVLPDYDRDRVYQNDIRKLIQWYNILVGQGYTEFVEPEEEAAPAEERAEAPEAGTATE